MQRNSQKNNKVCSLILEIDCKYSSLSCQIFSTLFGMWKEMGHSIDLSLDLKDQNGSSEYSVIPSAFVFPDHKQSYANKVSVECSSLTIPFWKYFRGCWFKVTFVYVSEMIYVNFVSICMFRGERERERESSSIQETYIDSISEMATQFCSGGEIILSH